MQQRMSKRKAILNAVFQQDFRRQPTFLSELRWTVFRREMLDAKTSSIRMSDSYRKSFARTLHHHQSDLRVSYVRCDWKSFPATIARAAFYELADWDDISRFLRSRGRKAFFSFEFIGLMEMRWQFEPGSRGSSHVNLLPYKYLPVVVTDDVKENLQPERLPTLRCAISQVKQPKKRPNSKNANFQEILEKADG